MPLPHDIPEADFLRAVDEVVNSVARNFAFAHYYAEDVRQEARLMALEALPRYDPSRPLANFLHVHIRNRLLNLKRKIWKRAESPCPDCHKAGHCLRNPEHCRRYREWMGRNAAKQAIARPAPLEDGERPGRGADAAHDDASLREALARIDAALGPELRADYLRLRAGRRLSDERRRRVMEAVRAALGDYLPPGD
jgi:DNA-directed RNA polymerase specialized sigma24 family protein